ncbi:MAG: MBL fold metallo-hydrolase [Oscillospiraceae bacterium]
MKLIHVEGPYPYATNTFVLISSGAKAIIIDPAAKLEQYTKILQENNAQLVYVLLTHGHHDHIASAASLCAQTGAKLVMHSADAKLFNMQYDIAYQDGTEINVDDICIKPIFTPGHTPGSVCLLCADVMFAGDTLFAGDVGRTDLEGGNFDALNKSLARIGKEVGEYVQVLPGHDRFSTMKAELSHNPYLRAVL